MHGLREEPGHQRGVLGGLHHDRAAGREGRGDLGHDLVQGVVPGRDRGDDTDRLVVDHRVAGLLLEGVRGRQLGVGARDRDRHGGVDGLRELQRRAEFGRDGLGDLVRAGHEPVPQGGQAGRALGGRGRGPAGQGVTGGPYGGVDVLGGARRDRADDLLVDRVHDLDHVLAGGGAPGAPDVHAVVCLHRASSRAGRRRPAHKLATIVFSRQTSRVGIITARSRAPSGVRLLTPPGRAGVRGAGRCGRRAGRRRRGGRGRPGAAPACRGGGPGPGWCGR